MLKIYRIAKRKERPTDKRTIMHRRDKKLLYLMLKTKTHSIYLLVDRFKKMLVNA